MDDLDAAVLEFIKEYPCPEAYLVQPGTGVYDPTTASVSGFPVENVVEGILMDLTLKSNGLSVKYGTLVQAGDKEFLMRPPHKTNGWDAPIKINPESDKISVSGIKYQIVTLKELNPTGADPVLITLYLRR